MSAAKKAKQLEQRMSKRFKVINEKINKGEAHPVLEAIELLKSCPPAKFKESVDVSICLGVDPKKSDQVVRGAALLPHGTGRLVKVAVFAEGDAAAEAEKAGADIVGYEELVAQVKKEGIDANVVIATPTAMRLVGQLGQVLGPKGLMPNPKLGTVSQDTATAVKNAKAGQARYRTDKAGIIHCSIGRIDFDTQALKENLDLLISELKKAKPESSKGAYLKKIVLSTTMGPGITVDLAGL